MKILFLTWDGPQTSYLEGLFSPIFEGLRVHGYDVHAHQFTWGPPERIERTAQACASRGVGYSAALLPTRFRLGPPAKAWAVATARWPLRHLIRRHGIDGVLARSTLPGLMALATCRDQTPLAFDADGLPLDERVDTGQMAPSDLPYRVLRDVESAVARRADVVLTRSAAASAILGARVGAPEDPGKYFVVRNGRPEEDFRPADAAERRAARQELGIDPAAPLLLYAGSLGAQYCRREMALLFGAAVRRRPDCRFLVLSNDASGVAELRRLCGPDAERLVVRGVPQAEVARFTAAADLGLALRAPVLSMRAVAPIKVGEYLLSGTPVLAEAATGDLRAQTDGDALHLMERLDAAAIEEAAAWFVDTVLPVRESYRMAARECGLRHFTLAAAVESYRIALDAWRIRGVGGSRRTT